ncbi:ATP-dependent translocase ABCB1-like isoform X2 [Xenia sp. Carnegie-2017]|uniref:ATP-dependent translocase ABCB1-like isoform X2 n=1 Tax=Xenia sp. Carnegie-2017 TaxID=2897299 RepID=UPI001F047CA4|nr:ATP-dependent translocase ABCB1-like isoform X2 [Xenia sp. Carnegie-2017]
MASEKTPLLISGDQAPSVEYAPKSGAGGDDAGPPNVSVGELLRFCERRDKIYLTIGVIGCLLYGFLAPGQFILFGHMTQDLVKFSLCKKLNCSHPLDVEESMTKVAIGFLGLAVANFVLSWLALGLFGLSAERQVHRMRLALVRNVIFQEIGWFDAHSSGEILTRLSEDINKIADGIGSKFGRIFCSLFGFMAGYIVGFVYCWRLSLVMLAQLPMLFFVGGIMATITGSYTSKELEAYSKAGHIAEQSISSIKTVSAFGAEKKQGELYEENLATASKFGEKKGIGLGIGMGLFQLVLYSNIALSLWYLIKLVRDKDADPGDAITAFFAVITGSVTSGQSAPSFEALAAARGSGYAIFELIDRTSKIDASSHEGTRPTNVKGDVEFSGIDFVYPTRQSVQILKDFSLKVPSGKRVALVGESGCGKSTVVKLVQRFYDPDIGSVKLDGTDIKSMNISYLRSLIGVVNQEPVLFGTTIRENIAFGKEGATQSEIEEAAIMANAHSFITQFPKGYETLCGERGAKMSGGQKQRIAIARALIRNPKILLLDEATSALDSESEAIVQDALNKAGKGRTTIVIAHRLSTIKTADLIVSVRKGAVVETGTHEELMAAEGIYKSLVMLQEKAGVEEPEIDEEAEEENLKPSSLAFPQLDLSTATTSTHTVSRVSGKGEEEDLKKVSLIEIVKKNKPEWKYLVLGIFGASLFGLYPALYGLSLGGIFGTLDNDPSNAKDREEMEDDSRKWALYFFFLGVESGFGIVVQYWFLAKAGEALTKRLRTDTFLHVLRQDMSYFDKPENSTGAVCMRLSTDVSKIQGATGAQLGLLASSIATIASGLAVSFSKSWRITLAMCAVTPLVYVGGTFFNVFMGGGGVDQDRSNAGSVAAETISNIQTVVSLGREEEFYERYSDSQIEPLRKAKRTSHMAGFANGTLMAVGNIAFAVGFRYGGYLLSKGKVDVNEMTTSVFTIIMCAVVIGQLSSMTPDYTEARKATNRVFSFLEKIPEIDSYNDRGVIPTSCNGEVRLASVKFRYPTRRHVKVLRDLSFNVQPGQTVALVGTSGCGKSTSISLVERFYDTRSGRVMIDGYDVKELNLKWLRSQIGIVSQEPVLFDVSIKENIAYGDTTRTISDSEIEEAARSANIHDFISKLPQGYDTVVGDKGALISGGQKQRVAIARALIRDPKILLLDEATSALDTESEKVVQEALDRASIGRTTLVIAHRLSTIQHADAIMVIRKGKVIERGTHEELLALKGVYFHLHSAQSLSS